MWNVVFVMGFESFSMTARGMEFVQAAHRFFSPWYLVAMTPCSYRPKTEDEKHTRSNKSIRACVSVYLWSHFLKWFMRHFAYLGVLYLSRQKSIQATLGHSHQEKLMNISGCEEIHKTQSPITLSMFAQNTYQLKGHGQELYTTAFLN